MTTNDPKTLRLIAVCAYNLYRATLVGNPAPMVEKLGNRMRDPQVGDLVLEISSLPWKLKDELFEASSLGIFTRGAQEPVWTEAEWNEDPELGHDGKPLPYGACPTEKVFYLDRLDGKGIIRWHNADFIAIPTENFGYGWPDG